LVSETLGEFCAQLQRDAADGDRGRPVVDPQSDGP
jgi:hypothetical protein